MRAFLCDPDSPDSYRDRDGSGCFLPQSTQSWREGREAGAKGTYVYYYLQLGLYKWIVNNS